MPFCKKLNLDFLMKKLFVPFTILCFFISFKAFANGECGKLNVVIQNYTGVACTLVKSQVQSGYLTSKIPQSIPPNQSSETITFEQGYISGISSIISYRCGSETVELFNNQNHCLFKASQVKGHVYTPYSIHAKYIAQNGSWWSSYAGRITWSLF